MISSATPEGNAIRCPICTTIAAAAEAVCPNCGNSLAFSDSALITISLAAFPKLDREVIERIRKLFNEVKPLKLRMDFERVQLPSPAVFASFLMLVKDVKKAGGTIAVRNIDPKIHDMFVITRVDGLIETETSG
jgi:anti-anti-sigma regulatory factor